MVIDYPGSIEIEELNTFGQYAEILLTCKLLLWLIAKSSLMKSWRDISFRLSSSILAWSRAKSSKVRRVNALWSCSLFDVAIGLISIEHILHTFGFPFSFWIVPAIILGAVLWRFSHHSWFILFFFIFLINSIRLQFDRRVNYSRLKSVFYRVYWLGFRLFAAASKTFELHASTSKFHLFQKLIL